MAWNKIKSMFVVSEQSGGLANSGNIHAGGAEGLPGRLDL